MNAPLVWSIAGSDPTGKAGIQRDLLTFKQLNVTSGSIITAVTAQNANVLTQIHYLASAFIEAQWCAFSTLLPPKAIKIGMVGTQANLQLILHLLKQYSGKVVLDPILWASVGGALFEGEIARYLSSLRALLPYIYLITPNRTEAETVLKMNIQTHEEIESAARAFIELGVKHVLIKGGHFSDIFCQDYYTDGKHAFWLASHREKEKNIRGTGCILSSAIAACLALDYEIKDAIVIAKMLINREIRLSKMHAIHSFNWPEEQIDLPYLSQRPISASPLPFDDCGPLALGLYPIVDSSQWLERLLPLGVNMIQLRIKNKNRSVIENEIKKSVLLAKQYDARLFINDAWEDAISCGAYGVHLGQEDLLQADIDRIRQAGLRLGISTHCYAEVAHAHAYNPSYLACGPIYETTSKSMTFAPQGLEKLARWQRTLSAYPLVAIGGINAERMKAVLKTGVKGIAMISSITKATDPISQTRAYLSLFS